MGSSLLDDIKKDVQAPAAPDLYKEDPNVVVGSTAKALSPTPPKPEPKGLLDDIKDEVYTEKYGAPPTKPHIISDQSDKKSLLDDIKEEVPMDSQAMLQDFGKKVGAPVLKGLYKVLDAEENFVVKKLYQAAGALDIKTDKLKPKAKDEDYTWKNVFMDLGAPEDRAEIAGMVFGIGFAPSTYLTFGEGPLAKATAKLGLKGGYGLTEKGLKAATEMAASTADFELRAMKEAGKEVTQDTINSVKQKALKDTVVQMQTDLSKGKEYLDYGGLKWAGMRVLDAPRVKSIMDNTGLTKSIGLINKAADWTKNTKAGQQIGKIAQPVKESVAPWLEATSDTYRMFGRAFVKDFGRDKDILDLWGDAVRQSKEVKMDLHKQYKDLFKGFAPEDVTDFAESAIQADLKNPDKRVYVEALSGNKNTQELLDRYYAQGKYEGKKRWADEMADKLPLVAEFKRPNYFPGIISDYVNLELAPEKGDTLLQRLIKTRTGADADKYTRDAVTALATRHTQIAFGHIQNDLYNNILKKGAEEGIGGARTFKNVHDADLAGYTLLERPKDLDKLGIELPKQYKGPPLYFKKDFVQDYNTVIRDQKTKEGLLGMMTNVWKRSVTLPFPSFHVANATGNIVLNSLNIGKHAINPQLYHEARNILKEGASASRFIKTDLGEKLSFENIFKEASARDVIVGKEFVTDLGGEKMSEGARATWLQMLNTANPLSADFVLNKAGSKLARQIENEARLVNYLAWRKKGLPPDIAAKEAINTLFDYGALTKTEEKLKLIFPFYTFARKNLEAWTRFSVNRPGAVAASLKAIRAMGPTEEELKQMPEWKRNNFMVKMGDLIMTGYRLPFEDIWHLMTDPEKELEARLNPMLKYGFEKYVVKKDLFTDRPLKEVNYGNEFKQVLKWAGDKNTNPQLKAVADKMVRTFKIQRDPSNPNKIIMDPGWRHIIAALPTARFMSLSSDLTDEETDLVTKAAGVLTGIRPVPLEGSLAQSVARAKAVKKASESVVERNIGRPVNIPQVYGGREFDRKRANKLIMQIKDAKSDAQREALQRQLDAEMEARQKANVEAGIAK